MIRVIRKSDGAVFQIDGARGKPIVPVLTGEDAQIFVDGMLKQTVGMAAVGPARYEHEIHGFAVIFGIEVEVIEKVRARLNPASPNGNGDARVWTVIQQLCNSECGFDGSVESLFQEPPLDLARFGADAGNWVHHSVVQVRPPNP